MSACGAETLANELAASLTAGENFDLPEIDLNTPEFQIPVDEELILPAQIGNEQLTTRTIGGDGTFDAIMESIKTHLTEEFDKGRITGENFSKSYTALTEAALGNAVQFLLQRDQAYWQAITAQLNARAAKVGLVTARVQLETAKAQLQIARIEASKNKAEYALIKMKLATESATYCAAKFNLENILPVQKTLLEEQVEVQRAQTMETRTDGVTPVEGMLGKQKSLYNQQIISYQRDAEVKMTKLFTDAWITQKTIDEGLLPPTAFNNASLDQILTKLKLNHNLS